MSDDAGASLKANTSTADAWTKLEPREQSFGSSYDPVLCGVADGLARLFPPIYDGCWIEGGSEAVRDGADRPGFSGAGAGEPRGDDRG